MMPWGVKIVHKRLAVRVKMLVDFAAWAFDSAY